MALKIDSLRQEYSARELNRNDLHHDPFQQFEHWFEEAMAAEVLEPNAFILSTISQDGFPSGRTLLLKGFDRDGFVFYTNYRSQKGRDISANPKVSITFLWKEIQRQIRIQGEARKTDEESATRYFKSRPRASQLGAWASPQSELVESRQSLIDNYQNVEKEYHNLQALPKPGHWGGYVVRPHQFEFWQGRPSRLHDRFRYRRQPENESWKIERLAP